ncbi:MAG: HisA/HisF-related TIM barrel protein [Beijerinckiaceae bacterium]|nr:HisA/HisF-related TIM barrel protein [Beijerinckiaceae bacterium]
MPNPMIEVIPVIDLQGGAVVRACQGRREAYAPIKTPLAQTSTPIDVTAGLLRLYPFQTLYIADLDRIELQGSNERCIDQLATAFPNLVFWVDAGVRNTGEARSWLARHGQANLVLGSETLESSAVLKDLASSGRTILSLDFRCGGFLGPGEVLDVPHLWPARVIVMTLTRVGSNSGPDIERLAEIKLRAPDSKIYAAGGLRGASDFLLLRQAGIRGVLAASALHGGQLTGADLAAAMPRHAAETK